MVSSPGSRVSSVAWVMTSLADTAPMAGQGLRWRRTTGVGAAAVCMVALAGCSAQPTRYGAATNGRVFDSRLGVYASPKLVADGEPVPRGGGGYLVGRPYTIGGRAYVPSERVDGYTVVGTASWYGDAFHGRRTANGEIFDKGSISAAHPTLPLPSYVRVTNLGNDRSMIVRVNDRGPYHGGRVMDVSQRVAEALAFKGQGTARIKVDYIGRAGLGGSDDGKLMATLRTDGGPAQMEGSPSLPTMLADALPLPAPGPLPPPPDEPRRVARTETMADPAGPDPMSAAPLRPRGRLPVPPQRPYDFVSDAGPGLRSVPPRPAPATRAERPVALRSEGPGSGRPALISFAAAEPVPRPRAFPKVVSPWRGIDRTQD